VQSSAIHLPGFTPVKQTLPQVGIRPDQREPFLEAMPCTKIQDNINRSILSVVKSPETLCQQGIAPDLKLIAGRVGKCNDTTMLCGTVKLAMTRDRKTPLNRSNRKQGFKADNWGFKAEEW